jgi:perosamine synthetase
MTEKLALLGGTPVIENDPHIAWPSWTPEDEAALIRAARATKWSSAHGPEITALQKEFAERVGVRHCLVLINGTAVLHSGLKVLGIEAGDEVIVPAYSMSATSLSVLQAGAKPVFVDINPATGGMDPSLLADALTSRTAGIMPVHIDGTPADMNPILAFAEAHGLAVVADAAQAAGTVYDGRSVATLGDVVMFSGSPTKVMPTIEAGFFCTNSDLLLEIADPFTNFGERTLPPADHESRAFVSEGVGWKYRNNEFAASLARTQLPRLTTSLQTAAMNAAVLASALGQLPGLLLPEVPVTDALTTSAHWKYRVRLDRDALRFDGGPVELRDRLILALRAEGVPCGRWQVVPLGDHPPYRQDDPALWRPDLDMAAITAPRDLSAFPKTRSMLDGSLILGNEHAPLHAQTVPTIARWAEAFAKVLRHLPALYRAPYEPLTTNPVPVLDFV